MLTRPAKKEQVLRLSEDFSKSQASFLVNCIGLSVEETTTLRKTLKGKQANIRVIRNTLAERALAEHKDLKDIYSDSLQGTNAFVLAFGEDASSVAKVLYDLEKDSEAFKIKQGCLQGSPLKASDVIALAQLPSKEVLRARFLSVLQGPMTKFVRTLQEVPGSMVRVLNSYGESKK